MTGGALEHHYDGEEEPGLVRGEKVDEAPTGVVEEEPQSLADTRAGGD